MRKTYILKTLKQLKDDEWSKQLAALNYTQATRRYTGRVLKAQVLSFSPTVSIVAPRVSTVESITVMVELSKPTKGLMMLLSPATLEYLRNVVSAQLDMGGSSTIAHVRNNMEVADRVDTDVPNLFWSYRLNKYRAVFYPPDEGGNKKQRREYLTESKESATAFAETGTRPIDTVAGGYDDDRTASETSEAEVEDEAVASGIANRSPTCGDTREDGVQPSDIV